MLMGQNKKCTIILSTFPIIHLAHSYTNELTTDIKRMKKN